MELYEFLYKNITKTISTLELKKDDEFEELFLLTCLLIKKMSCGSDKQLKRILTLLEEFDYEKNFKK